ncbi:unnamed protein product, partial [Linum tenue]
RRPTLKGSEFLREKAIPRERKRRTRVPKCHSLIFITIGARLELGEVPIERPGAEIHLHSMISASEYAFASFSME